MVSTIQIIMMVVSLLLTIAVPIGLIVMYRKERLMSKSLIWGLILYMITNLVVNLLVTGLRTFDFYASLAPFMEALITGTLLTLGFIVSSYFLSIRFYKDVENDQGPIMMTLGFMVMSFIQTIMGLMNYIMFAFSINRNDTGKMLSETVTQAQIDSMIAAITSIPAYGYLEIFFAIAGDFVIYATVLILIYKGIKNQERRMRNLAIATLSLLVYRFVFAYVSTQPTITISGMVLKLIVIALIGFIGFKSYNDAI